MSRAARQADSLEVNASGLDSNVESKPSPSSIVNIDTTITSNKVNHDSEMPETVKVSADDANDADSGEEVDDLPERHWFNEMMNFSFENQHLDPSTYYKNKGLSVKRIACDTLRKKISTFLATKEMTQQAFVEKLGVTSSSFDSFMSCKGRYGGKDNATYNEGMIFFAERDKEAKLKKKEEIAAKKQLDNEKRTSKKRKAEKISSSEGGQSYSRKGHLAIIDELLELIQNTDFDFDAVYDDCDVIRSKIRDFQRSFGVTMNRYAPAINTDPQTVTNFMMKKGYNAGASSKVYLNSYIFFEKFRLFKNESKTKTRLKNEQYLPSGFRLQEPQKTFRFVNGVGCFM